METLSSPSRYDPSAPPSPPPPPRKIRVTPPKKFRKEGTQWLLTFPKAGEGKTASEWLEQLLEFLEKNHLVVVCAIVAKEKHKDGSPHLHMCFKLETSKSVKNCNFWDPIVGKHGDIGKCRDFNVKALYCAKDGDFATHNLDIEALKLAVKDKKAYGFEACAKDLRTGKTIEQVCEQSPGFVLQHAPKLEYFLSLLENWSMAKDKPALPWNKCSAQEGTSFNNTRVADWLNDNLFKTIEERGDPLTQLWVCGKSQIGKSTLVKQLSSYCRIFDTPMDGDWYDGFTGHYDLIVVEEFKGQKPVTWMNRYLDKFGMQLNQRKKKPFFYKGNIPVIVMSNLPPCAKGDNDGCYKKISETECEALVRRVTYVEMGREDLRIIFNPAPLSSTEDWPNTPPQHLPPPPTTRVAELARTLPDVTFETQEYLLNHRRPEVFSRPTQVLYGQIDKENHTRKRKVPGAIRQVTDQTTLDGDIVDWKQLNDHVEFVFDNRDTEETIAEKAREKTLALKKRKK